MIPPVLRALVQFVLLGIGLDLVAAEPWTFHARVRSGTNTPPLANAPEERLLTWDPARTAVVVCDMWDQHHCPDATDRVGEMAPRMNEVLKAARERGALIIHCPSDTLDFYKDHPGRRLAQAAPKVETRIPLQGWCSINPAQEPPLPIDDSDGGCDGCPDCPGYRAWTRQHPALEIRDGDAITDSAEAFYLMRQRGITNVLVMGVHINICVLGRPFAIRQMVQQGQNVVLVRDLTDSMYNHRKAPYVSHFRGTELVVEHIERHWCPSITSADLIGGQPFRFRDDVRKRIALVIGENEYRTWETLPEFAQSELAWRGYDVALVQAPPKEGDSGFTNIAALRDADLVVVSVRRRAPPKELVTLLKAHLAAGKPIVGLRTASHAFDTQANGPDTATWPTFDVDAFGARYSGHYNNKPPTAPHTRIEGVPEATGNPVLTGVTTAPTLVTSHLYRVVDRSPDITPLLRGQVEGRTEIEPVAWTSAAHNRRAFYTSLGNPDDFASPSFRRLLLNGILWCLQDPIPPSAPVPASVDYAGQWRRMKVPGTWEENSGGALSGQDGLAWYRCRVQLPESWRGQDLQLRIGDVDNAHEAFVEGQRVGGAGAFPPRYANGYNLQGTYEVPGGLTGSATGLLVAIRVYDHDGRGGFKGSAPVLRRGEDQLDLKGDWGFRVGDDPSWSRPETATGPTTPLLQPSVSRIAPAAPPPVAAPTPPAVPSADRPQETADKPLAPAEAARRFQVADDLVWEQVLSEPEISQPVFLNFDERGRMWVVEYRQYPAPAGLTLVSRDSVWRAVYDSVPRPPPNHVRGADRISIHEDADGNGTFERHKVFVDGLNIATSVERGHGGVWVLNPPYLLFYPDANGDDVPDGDPEVRLSGFGLEDTHSVANSLRWGPDGWLYGAQGSTVTANILVSGPDGRPLNPKPLYSQGQNIWRYHPGRRVYEVFSEGGGNAFGCEFDSAGRVFSGHNGGDTRGFHYQQGAYLQKGFEKHGPLSNPYAFGYFPAMPMASEPRFTHNFVIYDHGALPARYTGRLLGVEPLQGRIVESDVLPDRSSFKTLDVARPVVSDDRWFRPVDIKVGPDGAVYVCDWYDRQVNHYRNHEGQIDVSNGRIYRMRSKADPRVRPETLATLSHADLIQRLSHTNRWVRQTALRLIADRPEPSRIPDLSKALAAARGPRAVDLLWALMLEGGDTEAEALRALSHPEPQVRLWTVRRLGDTRSASPVLVRRLTTLAAGDPDLEVRNQLACTARRLPAADAAEILRALCGRDEDVDDNRQPLLLWWALETLCTADPETVLRLYSDPAFWSRPMVQRHLLDRTARRWAQAGSRRELLLCAALFQNSPSVDSSRRLMQGFEAAFKGRPLAGLPDDLVQAMSRHGVGSPAFAVRRGDPVAIRRALATVADESAARTERLEFLGVLSEVPVPGAVPALARAYRGAAKDDALRQSVLMALQPHEDPAIAGIILGSWPALGPAARTTAQTVLSSRATWSRTLVDELQPRPAGAAPSQVKADSISLGTVRRLRQHDDPELRAKLAMLWPETRTPTTREMEDLIRKRAAIVRAGSGDPYNGRTLFQNTCAGCHRLFGQGGQVGPDLTVYDRSDLDSMLLSIVNPGAEIREGYEQIHLETRDGRLLSGFLVEKDDQTLVLRTLDNQTATIPVADIREQDRPAASLMPEGLLDGFKDQEVRDLFAYLRSTQPLVGEPPRR